MSEFLQVKHPIHPLLGLSGSIVILIFGLITAKSVTSFYFLGGVWLLFLVLGYWRSCLAVVPFSAILSAILAGITFAISKDFNAALSAIARILTICVAIIPGLALSPILLVRSFASLKIPRSITLGMMITLNFFPLLSTEIRHVREAMKTRGAGSILRPHIFYRAFLIPLIIRLVNISDTLALSVETRGFTTDSLAPYSIYKTVPVRPVDGFFLLAVWAGAILAVIL